MQKLIAAVVVVLTACGDGGGSLSIEAYPAALRDAFCAYAVDCGTIVDVEACRTTTIGQPPHLSASLVAAVEAGKVKFRGGDAQACVDALAGRSCDVTSESSRVVPEPCATIFVGTQGEGASCASDTECVSQVCEVPACDEACCIGACIGGAAPGRAKVGESCEAARCDDTAFCDEAAICVARKGAGSGCIVADNCRFGL
ncbi:MAG: hypothetical protein H7138_25860, partial [Myxococcales bacterium]|nr:hypothetical protein [Myxococcales bacterium]